MQVRNEYNLTHTGANRDSQAPYEHALQQLQCYMTHN